LRLNFHKIVDYLWLANVLVEVAICALLFVRGYFRRLPFFTAYLALNLIQAVFLYAIYHHYGDNSTAAYIAGWVSEAITLVARLCATVEVLRLVLRSYYGIWGMTWRLLAFICPTVLVFVGLFSPRSPKWFVANADRGYHLIFAVAIVLCLALIRYYPIPVEPAYKALLLGFCGYSCVKILIDTILPGILYSQYGQYWSIWQTLTMSSYLLVLLLWGRILLKPLPAIEQPTLLPDSVYTHVSPEINGQLQAMNRQLMNFWKTEGPQQ
jgi:hypothetical protein